MLLADSLRKSNDMQEAYNVLTKARQWQPSDPVLLEEFRLHHTKEAHDLVKLGRYDDAIERIQQALDLTGVTTGDDYINLANINLRRGRKDEAMAQFKEAIRLGVEDANIHYLLSKETVGDEKVNHLSRAYALNKTKFRYCKRLFYSAF